MTNDELDRRLAALEARAPAIGQAPALSPARTHRPRRSASLALVAGGLTLLVGASAVAGTAVLQGLQAKGYPGVENRGQPLHGTQLECMSPPDAERFLARKGFDDVLWQVESGKDKDGRSISTQQRSAPAHGYVVPGSIIDGTLYMVVDQRADASGVGDCVDMRMP